MHQEEQRPLLFANAAHSRSKILYDNYNLCTIPNAFQNMYFGKNNLQFKNYGKYEKTIHGN